jgi:hypothetical protein
VDCFLSRKPECFTLSSTSIDQVVLTIELDPYDAHVPDQMSLRMSVLEIAHKLRDEIQERLAKAGVEVIEARISLKSSGCFVRKGRRLTLSLPESGEPPANRKRRGYCMFFRQTEAML